jgi:hypothetical protein
VDANKRLFERFDGAVRDAGYTPMGGQFIDAILVAAPRPRNSENEKADIKAGRVPVGLKEKPRSFGSKIATRAGP